MLRSSPAPATNVVRGSPTPQPKKLPPLDSNVMSLEAKASTLGYELPSAESEIKRLEEVQRSLRDEFARKRRSKPDERSNLAVWLERHPDTTLGDLNLASSPLPVKAVAIATGVPTGTVKDNEVELIPDALGVGRYAMRGDLRTWLDHVAELGDRLKLDAGDWTAQDEKELERALVETTKLVVGKDDERNSFLCREHITSLLEMLSVIASRRFYVDLKALPLHEALDGLVVQVREWYASFLKFGHSGRATTQRKEEEESRKAETEDDIRKRQLAVGIAAAAHSQHILLTQAQLDQVLAAFYNQSHTVSKREKGRIERKLVESLTREDNVTANLQRMNRALQEKVSALQEAIERHLHPGGQAGEFDATANALNELRKPSAVENMNQMTQAMAEVLSKKRIREAEARVASLTEAYAELKNHHEKNVLLVERMKKENEELSACVLQIQKLWDGQVQAKAQQEEERRRMYGGLQSDQQFYLSSLTTLMNASLSTISTLLTNATSQADRQAAALRLLSAEQRRALPQEALGSGVPEARRLVLAWTTSVYNCAVTEASRATLQQLARLVIDDETDLSDADERQSELYRNAKAALRSALAAPQQEGTTTLAKAFSAVSREYVDPDRELVGAVAQRLDTAISEAKTKFRETRYIRSMLWWLMGAIDALCNGTYTDAEHGLSVADTTSKKKGRIDRRGAAESESREVTFPPTAVVAQDADYGYAWVDECKSLERIFMSLRALLGSSAEKSNINNVLLTAIETAADQTALLRARRQTAVTSSFQSVPDASDPAERDLLMTELSKATGSVESLVDLRLTNALEKGRDGVTMGRQVLLQIQQQQQEQGTAAVAVGTMQRGSFHAEVEAMYHQVHST